LEYRKKPLKKIPVKLRQIETVQIIYSTIYAIKTSKTKDCIDEFFEPENTSERGGQA
jgi:hypothetical protein